MHTYAAKKRLKALEAEFDFIAHEVTSATNNRTQVSKYVTAAADPTGRKKEALNNMIVDGKKFKEHPDFASWEAKGNMPVDIGTSARERLGLPTHRDIMLSELIGAIKRQKLEKE